MFFLCLTAPSAVPARLWCLAKLRFIFLGTKGVVVAIPCCFYLALFLWRRSSTSVHIGMWLMFRYLGVRRLQSHYRTCPCLKIIFPTRQKEIMSRDRVLGDQRTMEQHLFHGTGAAQIKSICTMNFNPHLAGMHGAVYGKGIYFARSASYSHNYTSATKNDMRHMFLAKVLTGNLQLGKRRLKRPSRRHDSCTDSLLYPSLFVTFKSCQCYPYFLIRYKEVNTAVLTNMWVRCPPLLYIVAAIILFQVYTWCSLPVVKNKT